MQRLYAGRSDGRIRLREQIAPELSERCLTGVAADGGAKERAQAFACAHVQRAVSLDPPQLNAIR